MDFKKRPFNLLTLWVESFKLANRTFGALVLLIFLFVVFLIIALFGLVIICTKMVLPGAMAGPFLAGISTAVLALIASYVVYFIFPCTLINMLSARADKVGMALPECFGRSLLPSLFLFLAGVLIAVPAALFNWVLRLTGSAEVVALGGLALVFFVYIPCAFTAQAIALRGENPISGIKYSIDLVARRYFRTAFMLAATWLLPLAGLALIAGALFAGIPLFFADSFDITHLTLGWYAVFFICACIYFFVIYFAFTANTLLFLNLDHGLNRHTFELGDAVKLQGAASSTVLPVNAGMPVQAPTQDILAPNAQVGMLKATVSSEETTDAFSEQHLDKVYSPENAKVQEYMHQEEDRMPTILFDDDMAEEIAKNQEIWNKKKDAPDDAEDNGPDNIKLSKR